MSDCECLRLLSIVPMLARLEQTSRSNALGDAPYIHSTTLRGRHDVDMPPFDEALYVVRLHTAAGVIRGARVVSCEPGLRDAVNPVVPERVLWRGGPGASPTTGHAHAVRKPSIGNSGSTFSSHPPIVSLIVYLGAKLFVDSGVPGIVCKLIQYFVANPG